MLLDLSVIVVAHDMDRELPRTLVSLCPEYQRGIGDDEYEVIVVDNGSRKPVNLADTPALPGHWHVVRLDPAPRSPAQAINAGLSQANGSLIGLMIDGSHLATPGMLRYALAGSKLAQRAVVTASAWTLGCDSSQSLALASGYDPTHEDELLDRVGWPQDGYRLFDIGAPSVSSGPGWLQPMEESNALFMSRQLWDDLGGADERFDLPGGGFLNLDLFRRALELPAVTQVVLLGEATFHQLHGDLAARGNPAGVRNQVVTWRQQYESIRGQPWTTPTATDRVFVGRLPRAALLHLVRSAIEPIRGGQHPLGPRFDQGLWSSEPFEPTGDGLSDAAIGLAQREFRAHRAEAAASVLRAARPIIGEPPELLRLLSLSSRSLVLSPISRAVQAEVHAAVGEFHELRGDRARASEEYEEAIGLNGDATRAHLGLARVRMPGPDYVHFLQLMHRHLVPQVYLEIGVATGTTIVLAQPPTVAIGVDPEPSLQSPPNAVTHLFALTSDEFFEAGHLARMLGAERVGMAFIDGLHHFDKALRDFANIERWSDPGGVVLFHDTIPLDARTQLRERQTSFWTGDVWKVVACLRELRPDLEIFTIATQPAGLTVVTGLDSTSTVVGDRFEETVSRYMPLQYGDFVKELPSILDLVPADWDLVHERLQRSWDWRSGD